MVQRNKYQQKEPKIDVGKLNTPDNREKYQRAVQENIIENRSWNTAYRISDRSFLVLFIYPKL
jgi:hypothetical protein